MHEGNPGGPQRASYKHCLFRFLLGKSRERMHTQQNRGKGAFTPRKTFLSCKETAGLRCEASSRKMLRCTSEMWLAAAGTFLKLPSPSPARLRVADEALFPALCCRTVNGFGAA